MPITIRDLQDSELPEANAFEHAAFGNNPLGDVLFPGPFDENSKQEKVKSLVDARKEDPRNRYMGALDEESGRIVAFAKWHVYDTEEAAKKSERPTRDFGPGTNPEGCRLFFDELAKKKKELMGDKPHYYLHMLYTNPEFQGRGAGGLLLKWGMEKADELGIPVYLESTSAGYPVYLRYGFEEVDKCVVDFSRWGGSKEFTTPLMVRQPVKK